MKPSRRTGIVNDPRFAGHCMGPDQPECQQRLDILCTMLEGAGLRNVFQEITPRRAEKKELLRVHSTDYIQRLEETEGKETRVDLPLVPIASTSAFNIPNAENS